MPLVLSYHTRAQRHWSRAKILIHRKTSRNSFHDQPVFFVAILHRRIMRALSRWCSVPESVSLCKVNRDLLRAAKALNCAKWYNKSPSIDAKIYFTLNANAPGTSHRCNVMPCAVLTAPPLRWARERTQTLHGRNVGAPRQTSFGPLVFLISLLSSFSTVVTFYDAIWAARKTNFQIWFNLHFNAARLIGCINNGSDGNDARWKNVNIFSIFFFFLSVIGTYNAANYSLILFSSFQTWKGGDGNINNCKFELYFRDGVVICLIVHAHASMSTRCFSTEKDFHWFWLTTCNLCGAKMMP